MALAVKPTLRLLIATVTSSRTPQVNAGMLPSFHGRGCSSERCPHQTISRYDIYYTIIDSPFSIYPVYRKKKNGRNRIQPLSNKKLSSARVSGGGCEGGRREDGSGGARDPLTLL